MPAHFVASVRQIANEKLKTKRQLDQLLGGLTGGAGGAGGAGGLAGLLGGGAGGAGGAGGLADLLGGAGAGGNAAAGAAGVGTTGTTVSCDIHQEPHRLTDTQIGIHRDYRNRHRRKGQGQGWKGFGWSCYSRHRCSRYRRK